MALSRDALKRLALTNVVEIIFTRRDKDRRPRTRRMLMTLDPLLLNSALGKKVLRFRAPRFQASYNAASKNLLIVWDIIMQDWRSVPLEGTRIIPTGVIPTRSQKNINNTLENKKAQQTFWEYFNGTILKWTPAQKSVFMDK